VQLINLFLLAVTCLQAARASGVMPLELSSLWFADQDCTSMIGKSAITGEHSEAAAAAAIVSGAANTLQAKK
jgi:hypothetical protein